jgi:hypothetical protein
VQVREAENQEMYLTFSPRFERICLQSKKRLLDYMDQKPANIGWANLRKRALGVAIAEINKKTDLKIETFDFGGWANRSPLKTDSVAR